mmetsp:Transcript_11262/g.33839  ORF Transcript_11262/g.33839 Transcript_11262/m.33839 type:complete len:88 (-) Transcript_11262:1992-2255(-)
MPALLSNLVLKPPALRPAWALMLSTLAIVLPVVLSAAAAAEVAAAEQANSIQSHPHCQLPSDGPAVVGEVMVGWALMVDTGRVEEAA